MEVIDFCSPSRPGVKKPPDPLTGTQIRTICFFQRIEQDERITQKESPNDMRDERRQKTTPHNIKAITDLAISLGCILMGSHFSVSGLRVIPVELSVHDKGFFLSWPCATDQTIVANIDHIMNKARSRYHFTADLSCMSLPSQILIVPSEDAEASCPFPDQSIAMTELPCPSRLPIDLPVAGSQNLMVLSNDPDARIPLEDHETDVTSSWCPSKLARHNSSFGDHTAVTWLLLPVPNRPLRDQARDRIVPHPDIVERHIPVKGSQTRMTPCPADANRPSCAQETDSMASSPIAFMGDLNSPETVSQTSMAPFGNPEQMNRPSGDHAIEYIRLLPFLRLSLQDPASVSQILIVPSADAEARMPVLDHETENTASSWPLRVARHFPVSGFHNLTMLSIDPDASSPLGDHATE